MRAHAPDPALMYDWTLRLRLSMAMSAVEQHRPPKCDDWQMYYWAPHTARPSMANMLIVKRRSPMGEVEKYYWRLR